MDEHQKATVDKHKKEIVDCLEPRIDHALIDFSDNGAGPSEMRTLSVRDAQIIRRQQTSYEQTIELLSLLKRHENGFRALKAALICYGMKHLAGILEEESHNEEDENGSLIPEVQSLSKARTRNHYINRIRKHLARYIQSEWQQLQLQWKDYLKRVFASDDFIELEIGHIANEDFPKFQSRQYEQMFPDIVERVVICGEAGCGKSTLLWRLAMDWLDNKRGDVLRQKFDLVLPFSMRALSGASIEDGLRALLRHDSESTQLTSFLTAELDNIECKALILLDGYDEIENFAAEVQAFWAEETKQILATGYLKKKFRNACFLITTRSSHVDQLKRASRLLKINGFTEPQVHQFLQKQHRNIMADMPYDLLRNPLCCSLYCRMEVLPVQSDAVKHLDLFGFVNAFVFQMLDNKDIKLSDKQKDDFLNLLGNIAFSKKRHAMSDAAGLISVGTSLGISDLPVADVPLAKEVGFLRILKVLSRETFEFHETIDFLHQVFEDYFCAYCISKAIDSGNTSNQFSNLSPKFLQSNISYFLTGHCTQFCVWYADQFLTSKSLSACPRPVLCNKREIQHFMPSEPALAKLPLWSLLSQFRKSFSETVDVVLPIQMPILRAVIRALNFISLRVWFDSADGDHLELGSICSQLPPQMCHFAVDECYFHTNFDKTSAALRSVPANVKISIEECWHNGGHAVRTLAVLDVVYNAFLLQFPSISYLRIRPDVTKESLFKLSSSICDSKWRTSTTWISCQKLQQLNTVPDFLSNLSFFTNLSFLNFEHCNLTESEFQDLTIVFTNSCVGDTLSALCLDRNVCIDSCPMIMAAITKLKNLSWLSLENCGLHSGSECVRILLNGLCEQPMKNNLQNLFLLYNNSISTSPLFFATLEQLDGVRYINFSYDPGNCAGIVDWLNTSSKKQFSHMVHVEKSGLVKLFRCPTTAKEHHLFEEIRNARTASENYMSCIEMCCQEMVFGSTSFMWVLDFMHHVFLQQQHLKFVLCIVRSMFKQVPYNSGLKGLAYGMIGHTVATTRCPDEQIAEFAELLQENLEEPDIIFQYCHKHIVSWLENVKETKSLHAVSKCYSQMRQSPLMRSAKDFIFLGKPDDDVRRLLQRIRQYMSYNKSRDDEVLVNYFAAMCDMVVHGKLDKAFVEHSGLHVTVECLKNSEVTESLLFPWLCIVGHLLERLPSFAAQCKSSSDVMAIIEQSLVDKYSASCVFLVAKSAALILNDPAPWNVANINPDDINEATVNLMRQWYGNEHIEHRNASIDKVIKLITDSRYSCGRYWAAFILVNATNCDANEKWKEVCMKVAVKKETLLALEYACHETSVEPKVQQWLKATLAHIAACTNLYDGYVAENLDIINSAAIRADWPLVTQSIHKLAEKFVEARVFNSLEIINRAMDICSQCPDQTALQKAALDLVGKLLMYESARNRPRKDIANDVHNSGLPTISLPPTLVNNIFLFLLQMIAYHAHGDIHTTSFSWSYLYYVTRLSSFIPTRMHIKSFDLFLDCFANCTAMFGNETPCQVLGLEVLKWFLTYEDPEFGACLESNRKFPKIMFMFLRTVNTKKGWLVLLSSLMLNVLTIMYERATACFIQMVEYDHFFEYLEPLRDWSGKKEASSGAAANQVFLSTAFAIGNSENTDKVDSNAELYARILFHISELESLKHRLLPAKCHQIAWKLLNSDAQVPCVIHYCVGVLASLLEEPSWGDVEALVPSKPVVDEYLFGTIASWTIVPISSLTIPTFVHLRQLLVSDTYKTLPMFAAWNLAYSTAIDPTKFCPMIIENDFVPIIIDLHSVQHLQPLLSQVLRNVENHL